MVHKAVLSQVSPWLHGAAQGISLGTNFEADDYAKPAFIVLGCRSELVTSPNYKPSDISDRGKKRPK